MFSHAPKDAEREEQRDRVTFDKLLGFISMMAAFCDVQQTSRTPGWLAFFLPYFDVGALLSCCCLLDPHSSPSSSKMKFEDSEDIWENGTIVRYLARGMAVMLAIAGLYALKDSQTPRSRPRSLSDSRKKTR